MAKKEITLNEFRAIVREQALKLKAKMMLENEKRALENELKGLINESFMGDEDVEDDAKEEIDEIFGFGKKPVLSPEEAIVKGTEVAKANPGKIKVHNILPSVEQKRKFLMYLGLNPNAKYQAWDASLTAPDGTPGFFTDSTVYSGQGSGGNSGMAAGE